jgi:hypothetical protein
MLTLNDIDNIESEDEVSDIDYFRSIQVAINSGSAWAFQGSYGRTMMVAIDCGYCVLGKSPARDYYGNRIPSRDEVKSGTKGSREYVVDAMGEEWANYMEAL